MRLVTQLQTRLDISILSPYTPSAEERADPKLYAATVRRLYGEAMGLPLVEQVGVQGVLLCFPTCSTCWGKIPDLCL